MNNIYDNGELLLGNVRNIKEYTTRQIEAQLIDEEDYEEIIEYLEDKKDTDIVCINYDFGMGLSFDIWQEEDKLESDLYKEDEEIEIL